MKVPGRMLVSALLAGIVTAALVFPDTSFSAAVTAAAPGSYQQEPAPPADGAVLYRQRCGMCHDNPRDYAPPRAVLERRPADDIVKALTTGAMKLQAAGLSADAIQAVAIHLTGSQSPASRPKLDANLCEGRANPMRVSGPQWNGWGFDLENTRHQPAPQLKAEDVPRLKVKWAFAYAGGRVNSQPTVVGDRLFVASSPGSVYSLDAKTGCTYWTYDPGAGVRAAISVGPLPIPSPARFAAYFGTRDRVVHALDAETGRLLWKTKIEDHPDSGITGSPVLYNDRLYVPLSSGEEGVARNDSYECCTFRGAIVALDAFTGKILWKNHSIQEEPKPYQKSRAGTQMLGPAGGAIWSAPTVDEKRGLIYAGTGDSYTNVDTNGADAIIAFDMATGKIKWINQVTPKDNYLVGCNMANPTANCPDPVGPDYDFGSSPILRTLSNGKQVLLAGQKSGVMFALDPDNEGKIVWQVKLGHGATLGGIQWGPAADEQNVYVAVSDVNAPTDKRRPGLTALKIATGELLWHVPAPKADCATEGRQCSNAQSAAVTAIPGVVFSGAIDGHLRAYSTKDGSVLWDVNTGAEVHDAVNGVKTRGGALNAGGVTIVGGVLYVNSGYGATSGQPGNALLAFTVDGK